MTRRAAEAVATFRPSSQFAADYVAYDTRTPAGRARDAFQHRLEAQNFSVAYLDAVERLLRDALGTTPDDQGLWHDLAFVLLARTPDAERVAQAADIVERLPADTAGRLRHLVAAMRRNAERNVAGYVPRRLNWSVTNACPMLCKGCYNPFVADELDVADACRVLDRIAAAGVESLMVSGGDPLLWEPLVDFLAHARTLGIAIGLDTTGVTLTPALAGTLRPLVDTIGLPLDGATPAMQRAFRRNQSPTLMGDLVRALEICDEAAFPHFRVHTVVHRANVESLADVAGVLSGLRNLDQWVLYQWWGRRASAPIAAGTAVEPARFERAVEEARAALPGTEVVGYAAHRRELANLFVQSSGQVVTFGAEPGEEFVVGNLLTDDLSTLCASPAVDQTALVQRLVGHGFT